MEFLQKIQAWLMNLDTGMLALVVGAGLDLVMRVFKTDKPKSLIRLGAAALKEGSAMFLLLSQVAEQAAKVVDQVVPDRVATK